MTVMGSLEPPETPGSTPQPASRAAPTAEHLTNTVAVAPDERAGPGRADELIERRGRSGPPRRRHP
ncbi:hypothetical protein ABZ734_03265 [Streptomyces sp. NPDC006660]|uniref:hypothetical protein n=1 Tax=Streptomyces sp. NPDC006660 TaxID=3156901 RepID=UPI0033DDEE55